MSVTGNAYDKANCLRLHRGGAHCRPVLNKKVMYFNKMACYILIHTVAAAMLRQRLWDLTLSRIRRCRAVAVIGSAPVRAPVVDRVITMEKLLPYLFLLAFIPAGFIVHSRIMARVRERRIERFEFPAAIVAKVMERYPHLSRHQAKQAVKGLREYFQICNVAGRRMVSMPSQVVDVAWHEFILFTRLYQQFCQQSLGHFLHHTPAEAMRSPRLAQTGIKRAWRIACLREGIMPKSPDRLPPLFALDEKLQIADGFKYALDCTGMPDDRYCAAHIGCSGCGGGGGWGAEADAPGCGGD